MMQPRTAEQKSDNESGIQSVLPLSARADTTGADSTRKDRRTGARPHPGREKNKNIKTEIRKERKTIKHTSTRAHFGINLGLQ